MKQFSGDLLQFSCDFSQFRCDFLQFSCEGQKWKKGQGLSRPVTALCFMNPSGPDNEKYPILTFFKCFKYILYRDQQEQSARSRF